MAETSDKIKKRSKEFESIKDYSKTEGAVKGFNADGSVSFKNNAGANVEATYTLCKSFGYDWDNVRRQCMWKKPSINKPAKSVIFRTMKAKVIGHFNKIASGLKRFIVLGYNNEVQGNNENGIVIGEGNLLGLNTKNTSILGGAEHEVGYKNSTTTEVDVNASFSSVLGGRGALVKRFGEQVLCAGSPSGGDKGYQSSVFIFNGTTTNNSATELYIMGQSGKRLSFLNDNFLMTFTADFMAYQTGGSSGSAGDSHTKRVQGTIRKVGTTTDLVGSVTNSLAKSDGLAITFSATADDTNDSLKIQVTGQNNKNVTHVVVVKTNQIVI